MKRIGIPDKRTWNSRKLLKDSLLSAFTLVFPSQCVSCDLEISDKAKLVCFGCASRIKWTTHLDKEVQHQIIQLVGLPCVLGAHSLFVFAKEGVEQTLIHRLKYQHSKQTGFFLGKRLGQKIKNKIQEGSIDLLVSVPSHHRKKYDRGYNQSESIAKGLSEELNIPLSIDFVFKTKNGSSQTQLNKDERAQNVKNTFVASRKFRNLNSIGLVDDVITSGATINELCKSIIEMNRSIRITIFVLGVVRHD